MLKKKILFLLIFSLPFQLGYHFWLPESYVASFRIDYLAPTFYITDLLLILFLAVNFKKTASVVKDVFTKPSGWIFTALIFVNLYASSGSPVTFFAWLRLGSYLLLLTVLAATDRLAKKVLLPFSLSLIFIITLSIVQFVLQSSLGGLFYFFGERPLSIALPNVAKINLPWGQLLRPYATFSHPNSLAGYLLVSLVILRQISRPKILRYLLIGTIFLTFSKSAIFALIFIELIRPNLIQSILSGSALGLLPFLRLDPSFSSRYYLLPPTLKIIAANPFFGVGLKQFIPSLAAYLPASQISYTTLQPVHHTFILMFAELGLLGVVIITKIFWAPLSRLIKDKKARPYLLDLFGIILLTGSLDHYWWTLPQNQLIIVLALALIINLQKQKSHALS
ncbi:MAG: O-antigen ligase family protein [Patescibacteria group bacterium]